jgi:hypothetical protein
LFEFRWDAIAVIAIGTLLPFALSLSLLKILANFSFTPRCLNAFGISSLGITEFPTHLLGFRLKSQPTLSFSPGIALLAVSIFGRSDCVLLLAPFIRQAPSFDLGQTIRLHELARLLLLTHQFKTASIFLQADAFVTP